MNAVDATDRSGQQDNGESPALLTIVLDTNPHAWNLLQDSLSLSKVVVNLLVFINAHIAINHANRVAVVASHSERAEWLYPTPTPNQSHHHGVHSEDVDMTNCGANTNGGPVRPPPDDPNKYRPFAHIEHALTTNLRRLMETTSPESLSATPATMMAGALTMALAYISKQSAALPTAASSAQFNYSDPSSTAGGNDMSADPSKANNLLGLTSRVLILSVSGDLADQYIPIMNSIFACQRLAIPIDILKLSGDTVFLQQAADATGGIYMALDETSRAGFLQYLMFAYLPDQTARNHLIMPGESEGVDFRAACFCHRRVVDVGFVCSICLSIFCEPMNDGLCLTCGSHLSMANYGQKPMVVPRKKKKKRKALDGTDAPDSRAATPLPV
ncbi:related to basic transcription factor 2 (35 kd SU) [Ramularia collo-cygni]|uniref:General transcription and DNA repair factor IIH subunit TFB4 n=1 Tax=Ramularia collo-cygni TaxID=112498 RepID=A0A2D3VD78_9PEZI|nr:related to basic transcription factor 2 (35 kd SU) [Ramularia collo-cygni]CZT25030.1 related to basic transcription factor 2 (35 kd SU) [Ramularia collo-cygni]